MKQQKNKLTKYIELVTSWSDDVKLKLFNEYMKFWLNDDVSYEAKRIEYYAFDDCYKVECISSDNLKKFFVEFNDFHVYRIENNIKLAPGTPICFFSDLWGNYMKCRIKSMYGEKFCNKYTNKWAKFNSKCDQHTTQLEF